MNTNHNNEMGISESEISSLTTDMVDAHNDSYPVMRAGVAKWSEVQGDAVRRGLSRRGFIATAGSLIAGGFALTALPATAAAAATKPSTARLLPEAAKGVPLDVVVAGLAASLENLAVATYTAALKAAGAGKLGKVPPAIGTFATTARSQHADHAAAWNSIIAKVGYKPITASNPVYAKVVNTDFVKIRNVAGVAELALTLESVAAATYLEAIKALSTKTAIEIAASIQPVEMQHVAILNFVLGKYPVPYAFASLAGAAPVSAADNLKFTKS
ncbi:MAG: ferritin-like domain-containing protein [Acidimicrobiales bacterium]